MSEHTCINTASRSDGQPAEQCQACARLVERNEHPFQRQAWFWRHETFGAIKADHVESETRTMAAVTIGEILIHVDQRDRDNLFAALRSVFEAGQAARSEEVNAAIAGKRRY